MIFDNGTGPYLTSFHRTGCYPNSPSTVRTGPPFTATDVDVRQTSRVVRRPALDHILFMIDKYRFEDLDGVWFDLTPIYDKSDAHLGSYALPPLMAKISKYQRQDELLRDAYYYEQLGALHGRVTPWYYGVFHATFASCTTLSVSQPSHESAAASTIQPGPVNVLLMGRSGEHISRDQLVVLETLYVVHVLHIRARANEILTRITRSEPTSRQCTAASPPTASYMEMLPLKASVRLHLRHHIFPMASSNGVSSTSVAPGVSMQKVKLSS